VQDQDLYISMYVWITSIVCFCALIRLPTKQEPFRNAMGTLVLSAFFGWVLWPFALVAVWKVLKNERDHRM